MISSPKPTTQLQPPVTSWDLLSFGLVASRQNVDWAASQPWNCERILKKRSQIDKRNLNFVRVDAVKGARRDGEEWTRENQTSSGRGGVRAFELWHEGPMRIGHVGNNLTFIFLVKASGVLPFPRGLRELQILGFHPLPSPSLHPSYSQRISSPWHIIHSKAQNIHPWWMISSLFLISMGITTDLLRMSFVRFWSASWDHHSSAMRLLCNKVWPLKWWFDYSDSRVTWPLWLIGSLNKLNKYYFRVTGSICLAQ